MSNRISLMHVITGLNTGGAEMMLYKLLSATDRVRYDPVVVSLTTAGEIGEKIRTLGISVKTLDMKRGVPNPWAIIKLARMMRRDRVRLVQCWMYHADLLGGLAARWVGVPVIWGLRQSNFDQTSKPATIRIMRWCARLSYLIPAKIVSCSEAARMVHVEQGYAAERMITIPNGFQTEAYLPDEHARVRHRAALNISADTQVIGHVGRYDPQKDHKTFIEAMAKVVNRRNKVMVLFCGAGVTKENAELQAGIQAAGIDAHCLFLGQRDDLAELYCAMDVLVSSSAYGEGFPNVIGEAMSCGVPCVVTEVGDSAAIVSDTGRVVPPRDPDALAAAILDMIDLLAAEKKIKSAAARRRIVENYALRAVAARYENLYEEVLALCAG